MKNNNIFCGALNAFQYLLTITQTNEKLQTIELICAIVSTVIIGISKLIIAIKNARKDDKITKEEVDEVIDIITDTANKINEEIEKK